MRDLRWALPAAFAWGFAEATVLFVVPDALLGWIALRDWRVGLAATAAATAGALLGGLVVLTHPALFAPLLPRLPGIPAGMIAQVHGEVAARGPAAMLSGPASGIPYKVYADELGLAHAPAGPFALLSVPARLERFLPVALGFGLAGLALRGPLARRPRAVLAAYVALWIVLYAAIYAAIFVRYGGI